MSAGCVGGIPVRSIASVGLLQGLRQGVHFTWDDHEMHVAGHQTVAQQQELVQLNVFPQEVQIHHAFGIGSENELPRIATLGYVMRNISHCDTG